MAERQLSFCCDIRAEESVKLKQALDDLQVEYIDSKETTVTETAESRYLESYEVDFNDGSSLKIDLMSSEDERKYHVRFRPGDASPNFEKSEEFLEEFHNILKDHNVTPHFTTVSEEVESIESNLPEEFSIDTGDFEKEFLQVSDENKKFGFLTEGERIEFYIRVENHEYENINEKKRKLLDDLTGWMNG